MSFLVATPAVLTSAAADLENLGATLNAAHTAAALPTTGILAAAGDEVSAAIASVFSGHGQEFQALSGQAAAFHTQFVQALSGAGSAYSLAEAANASPLQTVEQVVLGDECTHRVVVGAPADRGRGQRGGWEPAKPAARAGFSGAMAATVARVPPGSPAAGR